jgi:hypothetical protein
MQQLSLAAQGNTKGFPAIVRWIDLGSPIDRDYDPKAPEKEE